MMNTGKQGRAMAVVRTITGYFLAVVATTVSGSLLQTQLVLQGLERVGATIPAEVRFETALNDLTGFGVQFGMIVAIALAVGFIVAFGAKQVLKPLAPIAYPLGGACAMAAALVALPILLNLDGITPFAGARGMLGFALQCLAGGLGGFVFSLFAGGRRRA